MRDPYYAIVGAILAVVFVIFAFTFVFILYAYAGDCYHYTQPPTGWHCK